MALRFYFYLSHALGIKEGIKESRGELKKMLKIFTRASPGKFVWNLCNIYDFQKPTRASPDLKSCYSLKIDLYLTGRRRYGVSKIPKNVTLLLRPP